MFPQGLTFQHANTEAGIASLIDQLRPLSPTRVVVEASGRLERASIQALQAAGIAVAIVNPRQVKGLAIALGKAKTDPLDAYVLARFAQCVEVREAPPGVSSSPTIERSRVTTTAIG